MKTKKIFVFLLIIAIVILGYGILSWHVFKTPTFFSSKKDCSEKVEEYFSEKAEEEMSKKSADEWEKELRNTPPGQSPWSTSSQSDMQNMMREANSSIQPSGPWEQTFGFRCYYNE